MQIARPGHGRDVRIVASGVIFLLSAWSCGGSTSAPGSTSEACQETATKLRGCGLLSDGEVNCRLFENADYARCSIECLRPASCADIQAQTCDDITNGFASCLDRCILDAFGTIRCGDGSRVSIDQKCDGEANCNDGADEVGCNDPEPQFECDNGERVPLDYECDGSSDCADSSDERTCSERAQTLCPGGS